MLNYKHYNLNVNNGFVILLTSKLITRFTNNYTSKVKSQSIASAPSEYIYTLKMKCPQQRLYGQATFKNARAIFIFQSRAGSMGFIRAAEEGCPGP